MSWVLGGVASRILAYNVCRKNVLGWGIEPLPSKSTSPTHTRLGARLAELKIVSYDLT